MESSDFWNELEVFEKRFLMSVGLRWTCVGGVCFLNGFVLYSDWFLESRAYSDWEVVFVNWKLFVGLVLFDCLVN